VKYPKGRFAAAMLLTVSAMALSLAGRGTPAYAAPPPPSIMPGIPWFDTSGHLIQGHNGSVFFDKANSTYYWIGQDLTDGRFSAACYSSPNLTTWTRDMSDGFPDLVTVENPADIPGFPAGSGLTTQPKGADGSQSYYLIGNTQVMQDPATGHFFMWVSVSIKDPAPRPSSDFLLAVAESSGSTPCSSPYTWQRQPFQPFANVQATGNPQPVGDIGLFNHTDPSGNTYSYLTSADQGKLPCQSGDINCYDPDASGSPDTSTKCQSGKTDCITGPQLRVYLITPDGQANANTTLLGTVRHFYGFHEAPAMFQAGPTGPYFLVASHQTAWVPNNNVYEVTKSAPPESGSGTWGGWQQTTGSNPQDLWTDVVEADENSSTDTFTCDSQTFFVLPVQGTDPGAKTTYVYLGDRWDSSNIQKGAGDSLGDSGYVWLPLTVNTPSTGTPSLSMNCMNNWSISTKTGGVSPLPDPIFTLTNAGSGRLLDGPTAGGTLVQDPLVGSPTTSQKWKIINVPPAGSGPLNTPQYAFQNVASGQYYITAPCNPSPQICAFLGNPLELSVPANGAVDWQFVSVDGGPSLTLKTPIVGNVVDVQSPPDGSTLIQDPPGSPPTVSQQWTLTQVSGP
jgi:hypothetical protein